ncbi:MAG: hypothetical protein WBM50_03890 [Acidimicrobiales bacterium]|jgi:hypothetical protein
MLRSGDQANRIEAVSAAAGLLIAIVIGSWWTGSAAADGSAGGVLVRFVVSLAACFYYLVLYRVATGRSLALRAG